VFEDETVDVCCPKCGHKNSILVHEFEEHTEAHLNCVGCSVRFRVDADEFHRGLEELRKELEDLERQARADEKQKRKGRRKDDFQI
jgi:transcription elongation factor Elf1